MVKIAVSDRLAVEKSVGSQLFILMSLDIRQNTVAIHGMLNLL